MTIDTPKPDILDGATDIGPAPTPPPWCEPDTEPDWEQLPDAGAACFWAREFGFVWIAAADHIVDGRILRTPPRIHFFEAPRYGTDAATARTMAAQLLNAADVLDGAK